LEKGREELAKNLVEEVGKPLSEARHEEISSARVFREFASQELSDSLVRNDKNALIYVTRKPIGVTGLILPWNYPLSVLSWKLAPALLSGCTVVIKPSPYTPLNTLKVGEMIRSLLPGGVVNIVSGDDRTGEFLVESPAVRKIAFTGHGETGKKILAKASERLKRVSLELGGNDPAIVLKDFDMGQIANVFWSSFRNAGQICIAVKRLYVHETLFPTFTEKYRHLAKGVKLGNGMEEGVQMGPVNNREQRLKVEELVRDAEDNGGKILTGGRMMEGPGYFYPPTVITDVDEKVRIVAEEQFGPAIPIMPFSDTDEVLDRANSLPFGLGASVWTSDVTRGIRIAEELESGTSWINTHMVVDPLAPFGGVKESGIGRELGSWGVNEYMDIRTVHLKK
jgi:acyl-CoA reductase-like NAD-dependent aldehyde dehydrogenase